MVLWQCANHKTRMQLSLIYKDFISCLDGFGLVQMVSKPTRGDNIPDLFLTSNQTLVNKVEILSGISEKDQDQDNLLVKRRNDNHSPGPVIRELVPSFHQRSELSNTILCIFSWWDQRIGEDIPIPDSPGEEATFINICISNESLKCHRVLISTTPSFEDKVICWYTGFTFKTFI